MGIEERIKIIVAEIEGYDIKDIKPETVILDIGDSLDAIELVMAIEEEFGIEIPDEDAEKLITVEDIVKYIQDKSGD